MNVLDIINKTKRRIPLGKGEIYGLVNGYISGEIPDYQMSSWLMAVCLNGLTYDETFFLTQAMKDSGETLDLSGISGIKADKHSTGGVGDKTSLIIGPVAAACGLKVPKMSGRGLGHTGGTIDKLESIPGYRTSLPLEEFYKITEKTGFSIISQSERLCPADKKIYALRNATGTVDSIPLISSSIMSKKLAMNTDCILLDVKYGLGAFMKTYDDAKKLAASLERIGKDHGKKCRAVITDMNSPLGKNIGNALEVDEAVRVLRGECEGKLKEICLDLAADMLELAGIYDRENGRKAASEAISSGKALDVFSRTVGLHGGDPRITEDLSLLPQPRHRYDVRAERDMKITQIDSEKIGMTSLELGAGRIKKDDVIDYSAGIVMNCGCGDILKKGEKIMTLCSSVCHDFSAAEVKARDSIEFQEI